MGAVGWALVTAGVWGVVPLLEKVALSPGRGGPAAWITLHGLGVVLGLLVVMGAASPWAAVRTMPGASVLLLVLSGVLASFVGQWTFFQAVRTGGVSQVTPIAGAYPLLAALLGWGLLREPMGLGRVLGVVLVVLGVWCLHR